LIFLLFLNKKSQTCFNREKTNTARNYKALPAVNILFG